MKLLILTQKIDANDDVLGFFHGWVRRCAEDWGSVTVICLEKGEYDLPENVSVYSLGKEEGVGKWRYVRRFFSYIRRFRKDYDAVLVHMNQEYVLLGGVLWRVWGKRVALWYNHTVGTWKTILAGKVAHEVFHTSPYAYTARFPNARRMPAGIDITQFYVGHRMVRTARSIVFVGRLAPLKGLHLLIEAAQILASRDTDFTVHIYGTPSEDDVDYVERLRTQAADLIERGVITFHGSVPHTHVATVYNSYEIFVNLTPSGNYDKTVLEAMACGDLIAASSEAFFDILPEECRVNENDAADLADTLETLLALPQREKYARAETFQNYVIEHHALSRLSHELREAFEEERGR